MRQTTTTTSIFLVITYFFIAFSDFDVLFGPAESENYVL